jgi:hypothetical protein
MTPDPYKGNGGGPGDANNPQSWNHYAYVEGDPVNNVDPAGEFTLSPCVTWGDISWSCSAFSGLWQTFTTSNPAAAAQSAQAAAQYAQIAASLSLAASIASRSAQLRQQASAAITNMSSGCQTALGQKYDLYNGNNSLLYKANASNPNATSFLDVGGYFNILGLSPVAAWDTSAGLASLDTTSYYLSTLAVAFYSPSTGTVLVGSLFDNETAADQNLTLLHEMLHAYTGKGDIDLAAALGLGTFTSQLAAGTAITNYLGNNCQKPTGQ